MEVAENVEKKSIKKKIIQSDFIRICQMAFDRHRSRLQYKFEIVARFRKSNFLLL